MNATTNYDGEGNWMQTYTGGKFWPLNPREEDVKIEDIAHALSMICRFGGHCSEFYSVAQHSVLVSKIVPEHIAMYGLLHDATEAYIGDIPRPLKRNLWWKQNPNEQNWNHIRTAEAILHQKIRKALPYRCEHNDAAVLILADNIALRTEARDLMGNPDWGWPDHIIPLSEKIIPISTIPAKQLFLSRYEELRKSR